MHLLSVTLNLIRRFTKRQVPRGGVTRINPGKSHGQGPWVSHERRRLDDSSSANREARSCSILLIGEMRLQWRPRLEHSRLGLQVRFDVFGVPLLALIYRARSRGVHLRV